MGFFLFMAMMGASANEPEVLPAVILSAQVGGTGLSAVIGAGLSATVRTGN